MTIGYGLFLWKCPVIVRRADIDDYVLEQFQIRNGDLMTQIAREVESKLLRQNSDPKGVRKFDPARKDKAFWKEISPNELYNAAQLHPVSGDAFQTAAAQRNSILLRANYRLIEASQPFARIVCVSLLSMGALIFLLPSLDVLCRVLRKLFL